MQIGERLKKIRERDGYSQTDFARKLDLLIQTYARYEKGERELPDSVKIKLRGLGTNIDWLLTGEGEMLQQDKKLPQTTIKKIPVLRQQVSCGPGNDWESDKIIDRYIEPLELIPSLRGKHVCAFPVHGLSMIGAGLHEGDIVFVDMNAAPVNDDIYVFAFNGSVSCKLLKYDDIAGKLYIFSMHTHEIENAELIRTLDLTDMNVVSSFHLFGRVLGWMHENTFVSHR